MLETALRSFTTFFATVGPVDVAALYAALTAAASETQRRAMAVKGTIIASVTVLLFIVAGNTVLQLLGIGLPALRTAGGILLLLLAIEMVFRPPSQLSSTPAEASEARIKADISVFPLATPLIAGPGTLGAAVLLAAETHGDVARLFVVVVAMLAVMAITLALLLVATRVQRRLGVTGQNVIARIVGILLTALAVQFMFDGISSSGMIGGSGCSGVCGRL